MMKKISSESLVKDDSLKIKVGTMDKKNPQIMYIEMGGYITPKNNKELYAEDVEKIFKSAKLGVIDMINTTGIASKEFIFVGETADDRIKMGKRSHIDIQLSLKINRDVRNASDNNFKNIREKVLEAYAPYLTALKQDINDYGFDIVKTEK